jgi:hypothetical protein
MEKRVVRETILMVSNGGAEMFDDILKNSGCNVIRTNTSRAIRSTKIFIDEFGQGIPVAIVHGRLPDEASVLAGQLKRVCGSMYVIALSERIGQPTQDAEREYDVIIPHSCADLQDMMNMFLGCGEL